MNFLKSLGSRFQLPVHYKSLPIGFDLAYEKLHMLQMEKGPSGLRIRAAVSNSYPVMRHELISSPKEFRAFIADSLKKNPFKGKKISSYLPGSMTQLIHLEYQTGPHITEGEAIVKGVLSRLGGQPDDYVIDYLPVRQEDKNARNRNALVAAARKEDVYSHLDLLSSAGLNVVYLEIGPAALRRLAASLDTEKKFPSLLLINFGRQRSYLTLISGRRLLMDREITFGEENIVSVISSALDISTDLAIEMLYRYGVAPPNPSDDIKKHEICTVMREILKPVFFELAKQINKVLIFMASETRGETVERVYLLGSVARYPGAEKFIASALSIPVSILYPLAHFPVTGKHVMSEKLDPVVSIAMATGLALRGA